MRPQRIGSLRLYVTVEHPCGYLDDRRARNLVVDPLAVSGPVYTQLAQLGFRRSGNHVYRPHCERCSACRSIRIPVERFSPDRIQRRIERRNQDLRVRMLPPVFYRDHFQLFERYLLARHAGGGMDDATPESYLSFIESSWAETCLVEYRRARRLVAVSVMDRLLDGLSAVYTFFDPEDARRSPGTHAILWQIAEARRLGLPWLYLGYWIGECRRMAYKAAFRPHQVFVDGHWHEVA